MKSLRFENIWMLSDRDGKGRTESFHQGKNLLVGRNHTGKSSLLRTLFETLGARPEGDLEQWDENTISMVSFSVDDVEYQAVHQRGNRALFNSRSELLISTGRHAKWTEYFSKVVGFNLVFTEKQQGEPTPADPACFFLPFYINQDGSWGGTWNTFRGLKRFVAPWTAILEYFSGIAPPEYYSIKSERDLKSRELDEQKREKRLLDRTKERFGRSMVLNGPKLNPENFRLEIEELTKEVTELNRDQESLRNDMVREEEVLHNLEMQVRLAKDALNVYAGDTEFLQQPTTDSLECPTCGAEHTRSFLDVFTYAEDARVLRELVVRLQEDAREVREKHAGTIVGLQELDTHYRRVNSLLETRRGELQFGEVVRSVGAEAAFQVFGEENTALQVQIDALFGIVDELEERLKELRSPKRSKPILASFRDYYRSARASLNLPPVDVSRMKLTSRPNLSGSGGPRSVLAYYSALWRTCHAAAAPFSVPVVIDSPNQQGQDDVNLPAVLKFIAQDLPASTQLLVGLESMPDYTFDKIIDLTVPYSLLSSDHSAKVAKVVRPLVDRMYLSLTEDEPATAG